jgi:DNA-binding response OmpR family regulator
MEQPSSSRIMVIGSDLHFCYLMYRYVRESEHQLLSSSLDEKAVDLASKEKPALIVLEAGLPYSTSWTIFNTLKRNVSTCQIPVALCTWQETEDYVTRDEIGIFLRMPILYSDFLEVLSRLGI